MRQKEELRKVRKLNQNYMTRPFTRTDLPSFHLKPVEYDLFLRLEVVLLFQPIDNLQRPFLELLDEFFTIIHRLIDH